MCVLKKPVLIATLRHIVLSFSFLSISLRYRPQNLQSPLIIMDFYYLPGSAPCRAVQMTAAAVGVELNLKLTDLMKGEHMKPEFLKVGEPILGSIFHCTQFVFSVWKTLPSACVLNSVFVLIVFFFNVCVCVCVNV